MYGNVEAYYYYYYYSRVILLGFLFILNHLGRRTTQIFLCINNKYLN